MQRLNAQDRRKEIISCARSLYEERGMSRTSIKDITERLGVSRALFYHYFPDKESVTSAVLDAYVEDFIESLKDWNAQRRPGDIEHALDTVVTLLRENLFESSSFRRALASWENAALYIGFTSKVADRVASYIASTTVKDYGRRHPIHIDHVYESFYVLVVGLIGYLRRHPDASDEIVKDIIAQTLHLERGEEKSTPF